MRGAVARANPPMAKRREAAVRKAGRRRAVRDGHDAIEALRGNRKLDHRAVNVHAVADDFRGHFIHGQHRSHQPGIPVVQRTHAIVKMRRVARAGHNGGFRALKGGARVAQRHALPSVDQPLDQLEGTVQLGGQGDDADVGARALDLIQYFAAVWR